MDKHPTRCNCERRTYTLIDHAENKVYEEDRRMKTCEAEKHNQGFVIGGKLTGAKLEYV